MNLRVATYSFSMNLHESQWIQRFALICMDLPKTVFTLSGSRWFVFWAGGCGDGSAATLRLLTFVRRLRTRRSVLAHFISRILFSLLSSPVVWVLPGCRLGACRVSGCLLGLSGASLLHPGSLLGTSSMASGYLLGASWVSQWCWVRPECRLGVC